MGKQPSEKGHKNLCIQSRRPHHLTVRLRVVGYLLPPPMNPRVLPPALSAHHP